MPRHVHEVCRGTTQKTDAIALSGHTGQWVVKKTIQFIAKYVTEHLPMTKRFSLCHGTRSGREAFWFRESLSGIQVWSTELSPVAAATAPWTMLWELHTVRPEWRGAADFVYSNALDHSFNASLAVSSWLEELAPGGAVLIHWAGGASKATGVHEDTAIFSAGYVRLVEIFSAAGNVTEVVSLPTPQTSWYGVTAPEENHWATNSGQRASFAGAHIPEAADSADVVMFNMVLHHAAGNTASLLSEAARVTRRWVLLLEDISLRDAYRVKGPGGSQYAYCVRRSNGTGAWIYSSQPPIPTVHCGSLSLWVVTRSVIR